MSIHKPKYNLRILDGLRGLAAFYVMVGHARWLLWEGFSTGYSRHPEAYGFLNRISVYLSSVFVFGHEAVLFFFVLSGFVIHLRYSKDIKLKGKEATFGWAFFFYRRAKRLYPTLAVAMLLTLFFDWIGAAQHYLIYDNNTPYALINQIGVDHGWVTAVGNLAFVMPTYVPAWGTNGPLWSLQYEWWFYMIYPAFWWLSKKSMLMASSAMVALFFLSFFPAIWPLTLLNNVFAMMLAWWFGVLLADVFSGRLSVSFARIAPLSAVLLILPALHLNSVVKDILWAIGFTGLIAACFALQGRGHRLKLLASLKPLGDMSFTLYVIHFPLLVLASGYLMSLSTSHELPRHLGWSLVGCCIALAVSWVVHLFAEKPFVTKKVQETT